MIKKGLSNKLEETKIMRAHPGEPDLAPEALAKEEPEEANSGDPKGASGWVTRVQSFISGLGKNIRFLFLLVMTALGILFALQNMNVIVIRFAWMEIRIFQFIGILSAVVLGFLLGKVWQLWSARK